jgi:hypothetical protein
MSIFRPGQGNLPYHPAMRLKLPIYAYCCGVFSSRRIARQIDENIAFRVHFTNPESRIMKDGSGASEQCYNTSVAVDGTSRLIVANEVHQSASDASQLLPMVDQAKRNVRMKPGMVLADAGYASEENLRGLERRRIDGYVALGREGKAHRIPKSDAPATKRMMAKLRRKRSRKRYRQRKHIAEPPFGWMKHVLGFRQFSLRGQSKVAGEFDLVCVALNLRRMGKMMR